MYDCEVIKGGTGYSMTKELPKEVDMMQPDYSIFPFVDDRTAYGFLTRGCPNKCHWCCVPSKEGNIHPYMDIEEVTQGGRRDKVVLLDNNIIACNYGIEQLIKIADKGYRIDVNQASDARLMTGEIAEIYARIKWLTPIRFGCDTPAQVSECEKAMAMIDKHCKTPKQYLMYAMIHGSIEECYERLSHFRGNKRVRMVAQPFRNLHNPRQIIPQWQKDMARWAMRRELWVVSDFKDFECRKGVFGRDYFKK